MVCDEVIHLVFKRQRDNLFHPVGDVRRGEKQILVKQPANLDCAFPAIPGLSTRVRIETNGDRTLVAQITAGPRLCENNLEVFLQNWAKLVRRETGAKVFTYLRATPAQATLTLDIQGASVQTTASMLSLPISYPRTFLENVLDRICLFGAEVGVQAGSGRCVFFHSGPEDRYTVEIQDRETPAGENKHTLTRTLLTEFLHRLAALFPRKIWGDRRPTPEQARQIDKRVQEIALPSIEVLQANREMFDTRNRFRVSRDVIIKLDAEIPKRISAAVTVSGKTWKNLDELPNWLPLQRDMIRRLYDYPRALNLKGVDLAADLNKQLMGPCPSANPDLSFFSFLGKEEKKGKTILRLQYRGVPPVKYKKTVDVPAEGDYVNFIRDEIADLDLFEGAQFCTGSNAVPHFRCVKWYKKGCKFLVGKPTDPYKNYEALGLNAAAALLFRLLSEKQKEENVRNTDRIVGEKTETEKDTSTNGAACSEDNLKSNGELINMDDFVQPGLPGECEKVCEKQAREEKLCLALFRVWPKTGPTPQVQHLASGDAAAQTGEDIKQNGFVLDTMSWETDEKGMKPWLAVYPSEAPEPVPKQTTSKLNTATNKLRQYIVGKAVCGFEEILTVSVKLPGGTARYAAKIGSDINTGKLYMTIWVASHTQIVLHLGRRVPALLDLEKTMELFFRKLQPTTDGKSLKLRFPAD